MRTIFLSLVFSFGFIGAVQAEQLQACNQDTESVVCQHYLEGVVDGAMMYKPNATGARIETDSYESRALKYRGGKRFQEANRTYCESRIPDRQVLVDGLAEAFSAGTIQDVESLNTVMYSLMDCQRLK
ncbi:hypothetical protein Sps_02445 [Shewanella psychrophila]|uniref:Rap1a immunity protein domain-containing protein n=1 Tax=Shewanella psychrophila TaxID=225848 RepID=A0A1S6HQ15_9GAMM|nr:hypothetical protein [Shewanella psychrophila]AQS37599.1 hypothetical protein Sps_02445 [Shewanella psychrophila]